MQDHYPSAALPKRGRRGIKLLAGGVALTMASLGGLVAVTALPAFASVTSAPYTIGSPSGTVSNVAISPTTGTSGVSQSYQASFTATAALAESSTASSDGTITITPSPSTAWTAAPTNIEVIDSASGCFQSGVTGTGSSATSSDTATGFTVALDNQCPTIAAGQTVDVDFSVAATASFTVTVGTSANSTSGASSTVTINSVPPAVASNSAAFGFPAVYTFTSVGATGAACAAGTDTCGWSGVGANVAGIQITAVGNPGADTVTWDTSGTFTVSYTSGSTTTSETVTASFPSANVVDLALGTPVAAGDTFTITAQGTNPGVSSSDTFQIEPLSSTSPVTGDTDTSGFVGIPTEVTSAVTYGTQVQDVTVSASPSVSSATSTYSVAFKAQTAVTGGDGAIVMEETAGPTNLGSITGIFLKDVTANWTDVPNAVTNTNTVGVPAVTDNTPEAAPSANGGTYDILAVPLPAGDSIAAGDTLNLTLAGVTNPTETASTTISDFDVWTTSSVSGQGDTVSAPAASYTIGASGSGLPVVTPANSAAGATTNYTITNLHASAAITAGSVVTLTADAGTVLPGSATYYSITDNTTASGSGTASSTGFVWTSPGTSVSFEVPNAINSGDSLTLSIADVVNPGTGTYTMMVSNANISGPSVIAPFPQANVTYPNGSIIDFSGTDYLFAGGHAFGIATPTILAKLQAVDHATVQKAAVGSILPTTAPRAGTLITTNSVNANATIYAVGTDGQLHGFATGSQFLGDGYDPALTVTVPNLGGLTTGSTAGAEGTALTALATSADGAIVDSSNTYYVFDGGKAFGIPTPTWLTAVRKNDTATTLTGTVGSAQTGAGFASGALLTQGGTVYVGYVGDIFPFKSQAQFIADGYAGTASVTLPNLGGLSVVAGYSGS